jgi:hypothetical protein
MDHCYVLLTTVCDLGEAHIALHMLHDAEPLLEGRKKQFGETHPDTLRSIVAYAHVKKAQGGATPQLLLAYTHRYMYMYVCIYVYMYICIYVYLD